MPKIIDIRIEEVPLKRIKVAEGNVRREKIDEKGLVELSESIREHGLIHPIIVYEDDDGYFKIVIGQRRFLAKKMLGPAGTILCRIIKKPETEEDTLALSVSENIHRTELKRKEIANAIEDLYQKTGGNIKSIASVLGISTGTVYNYLDVIRAPNEAREIYESGDMSREDLKRAIRAGTGDERKIVAIAKKISSLAREEKVRLVEEGEQNPETAAAILLKDAKKAKTEYRLIIYLPENLHKALSDAATEIGFTKSELAKDAIKEWLGEKGYLK